MLSRQYGRSFHILLLAIPIALVSCVDRPSGQARLDTSFPSRIAQLSEPGGYFDTDNLVSNERSYLHVMNELAELGVSGGAYIGVGPDTNFSYIAQIRPSIVFIVDIRRDNMLHHLLFKALFMLGEKRIDYLSLLFGKPVQKRLNLNRPNLNLNLNPDPHLDEWNHADLEWLVEYIDSSSATPATVEWARSNVNATIAGFGVPLSASDLETIDRFHRAFIEAGLSLRFNSTGRPPRFYYPTYRELLLETDRTGREANYLASEAAFQFVQTLQKQDLVIPVVGNLAGDHALKAIGRLLAHRGEDVSAFYTSNVEFYLFQQGTFRRYVENLAELPRGEQSVIIRTVFGRNLGYADPRSVRGYYSTSLLQNLDELVSGFFNGRYVTYRSVINGGRR